MPGPLDGVRIVDFGQYIAGPLAALLLADQGAEVVHVDPPGGPRWNHAADAYYNRGKQRISLDLKTPADLETARRLIARADVLVENFRPGVMQRLGLGAEDTTAANPRLLYCSLPGFASDDYRAGLPAWEGVVSAAAAAYLPFKDHWNQSAFKPGDVADPERPLFNALPIASSLGGMLGATTIVAALIARQRTGLGQRIEIPLFDAMLEGIGGFITRGMGGPPGPGGPGRGLRLPGETRLVKDGGYVNSVAYARFIEWLLDDVGVLDAFTAEGLLDIDAVTSDPERNALMERRYDELMLTRSAEEWDEVAARLEIPLSAIRNTRFWLANEHARRSQTVVELDDPELGRTWMPGQPLTLDGAPLPVGHARRLPDADHAEVLNGLDAPDSRPQANLESGRISKPLEGFRVIDLTQVVAGPTAGRVLADFGAEVIKINNPGGTRADGLAQLNRGKRMLLLDIQSTQGQDVFWRLVDRADVVLDNLASDAMQRYGLGYDSIHAHKPEIVYAALGAFAEGGPWSGRRGHENQGQCVTGMMDRYGGDGPPLMQPYLVNDIGTGVFAAFGAMLGLYQRLGTGEGCFVRATLTQTATLHQAPYMLEYRGKAWDEPRGLDVRGWSPLQRMYLAQDGWFFLGATPDQKAALDGVEGLAGVANLSDDALGAELERRFATAPRETWVQRLQAAGAGAHALLSLADLVSDPIAQQQGSVYYETRGEARTPMSAPAPRLSATPIRGDLPMVRMPGIDAASILQDLGIGDRLQALSDAKVIRVPDPNARPARG